MPAYEFRLTVATRAYGTALLLISIGLVVIHCSLIYYHHRIEEVPWLIRQLFDLDEENNLPTWFSGFLLLNNSLVLFSYSQASGIDHRLHWRFLAVGFLVLSIDEVAGLHESFHSAIDINWAIPAGILVTLVGLTFIPLLLSLKRRLAVMYVLSGSMYVCGAIGVELLSEDMDSDSLAYGFATAAEESLEMFGAWLFLIVNLGEMREQE